MTDRDKPPFSSARTLPTEWVYEDPETMNRENRDQGWGAMMVQDVYQGITPEIRRGDAKFIQVVEQVQKSRCMAGGEAWGHTPIIGRGTVHVRRVIGRTPVHDDGSAHFLVPALKSISLNLLDGQGRTIMRMGSDMHVMPGETRGCVGCHEDRDITPVKNGEMSLALRAPAARPVDHDWGTKGLLDYPKVVQPIWNEHCVSCHGGSVPAAGISLCGDRTRFFCVSYDNLIDRGLVDFKNVFALDHEQPTQLSAISIRGWQHEDFSPRDFEIRCDGELMGTVTDAAYQDNFLCVRFEKTACSSIELVIHGSYGGSPAIRELGLYDL